MIRRKGDAAQLAAIEPVNLAGLAGVQNDVAGTTIWMRVHGPMALWAIDAAVELLRIGRASDVGGGAAAAGAHIVGEEPCRPSGSAFPGSLRNTAARTRKCEVAPASRAYTRGSRSRRLGASGLLRNWSADS